jgi:hypothetical protein
MAEVRKLVLMNKDCKRLDFSKLPWSEAMLVTPRHSVHATWNSAALHRHCVNSGRTLYIAPTEDTTGKERAKLSLEARVIIAGTKPKDTEKLERTVEIVVGMKATVTVNIATEADLMNGTHREIVDIILDPPGRQWASMKEITMVQCNCPTFPGLQQGLILIFPTEKTFTVEGHKGHKIRVTRRQMALTSGYVFTDYKAQGQTLECVIVDLAKLPTGNITPFGEYIALSRSRGRETIRLLRDFDDALLTTHPSDMLYEEDQRLQKLMQQTE